MARLSLLSLVIVSLVLAPTRADEEAKQDDCHPAAEVWDQEEIAEWMLSLSKDFKPYADKVVELAVDGSSFMDLKDEEFQIDLGVEKRLHLKRLKSESKKLRLIVVCRAALDRRRSERKTRQMMLHIEQASKLVVSSAFETNFTGGKVAGSLKDRLTQVGVKTDLTGHQVGEDLESILQDLTTYAVGLEALEWRTHEILSFSFCADGKDCDKALKNDLTVIMDAKIAVMTNFHEARSGATALATAISHYQTMMKRADVTSEQELKERRLLKQEFTTWKKSCEAIVKQIKDSCDQLLKRAKEQTANLQGAQGVRAALDKLPELTLKLREASANRTAILANGGNGWNSLQVKTAHKEYTQGLQDKQEVNTETIDQLQAKLTELRALEKEFSHLQSLLLVQRLKKALSLQKGYRGWLFSWISGKESSVDSLDQTKAKAELQKAITEVQTQLEQYKQDRDDIDYANSNPYKILETCGFFQAETDILAWTNLLNQTKRTLTHAMQQSGLPDAELAAKKLGKTQEVVFLMSEIATKTQVLMQKLRGWANNFDNLFSRMDGISPMADKEFLDEVLPVVVQSFTAITKAYTGHMSQISTGESRALLISSYAYRMLPEAMKEQNESRREV